MFVFWLPNQRFLSCRLIVPDSALLVADSALFGCRLIVADSALLVADPDRDPGLGHLLVYDGI